MKTMSVKIIFFILVSVFLTGCISNQAKPKYFYVLNPHYSSEALLKDEQKIDGIAVLISTLLLPPYLERKQIVTRRSDNQLFFSDENRWGGKLRKNLQRVLVKNLSHELSSSNIATTPLRLTLKDAYIVDIEISQFELNADNKVVLSAQWRLRSRNKDNLLNSGFEEIMSEPLSTKDDYQKIVSEMSITFSKFSHLIADAIATDVKK